MDVKGRKVRITLSENKCRIFIGNIPKELTRDEFMNILTPLVCVSYFSSFLMFGEWLPIRRYQHVMHTRRLLRLNLHNDRKHITINWLRHVLVEEAAAWVLSVQIVAGRKHDAPSMIGWISLIINCLSVQECECGEPMHIFSTDVI